MKTCRLVVRSKGETVFEYKEQSHDFSYMEDLLSYLDKMDFSRVTEVVILPKD